MKKYDNFCSALENLRDIYNYEEPYGNVELTGMVGLYEVCFEQSWKAMKEILERDGFGAAQTGSPRQILKTAFQAGMIDNEELWMSALADRNNVTHAYNKAVALDIIAGAKDRYCHMFETLKRQLEENWLY